MNPKLARLALAAVALTAVACGGDDKAPEAVTTTAPPMAGPTSPPARPLTRDPQVIASTAKNVATAQESYAIDAGTYTTKMSDLVEQGLILDSRVKIRLISATKKRYCFSAAGYGSLIAYYDSATGKLGDTPCT